MTISQANPYGTLKNIYHNVSDFETCFSYLKNHRNKAWDKFQNSGCQEALSNVVDEDGKSILMRAIEAGDSKLSQQLITNKIGLHVKDKKGNTAYHTAAKSEAISILGKLFHHLNLDEKNARGKSPLEVAIRTNRWRSVRTLLENGADISTRVQYKTLEISLFELAVVLGCIDSLQFLSKVKDIESTFTNPVGNILHFAVHFHQCESLKFLLSKDKFKALLEKGDKDGNTPLAYSVIIDSPEALILLAEKGANIDQANNNFSYPIHLAAVHQPQLIGILIHYECKIDVLDGKQRAAVHLIDQQRYKDEYNFLLNLMNREKKMENRLPHFGFRPPENLVFKGGGVKGIAYLGVLKALEDREVLQGVKRVAGTSAGAINSALIACGYRYNETEKLLYEKNLLDFIENKDLTKLLNNKESTPHKILFALKQVLKEFPAHLKENRKKLVTAPTNATIQALKACFQDLYNTTGLCSGDEFLKWIEQCIYEKTKIRHCTFGELKKLVEKDPSYKHLYVFASRLDRETPEIHGFNSEDSQYEDVVISTAVRASMSIPGVFEPAHLQKKVSGEAREHLELGTFCDGGLIYNLPLEAFDQARYVHGSAIGERDDFPVFNKRTLGFNLETPSIESVDLKKIKNAKELAMAVIGVYITAEDMIRQTVKYNNLRMVNISTLNVGTIDFNISVDDKKALIKSGRKGVETFYKNHQGKAKSYFYYPRVKKIAQNMINLSEPDPQILPREEVLVDLASKLEKSHVVVLYGPGGLGKKETAMQYAHSHIDKYQLLWVIDCSTSTNMDLGYRNLAQSLNISVFSQNQADEVRLKVHTKLQNDYKNSLLIFLGLQSELSIPSNTFAIIVSNQKSEIYPSIEMKSMSDEEAMKQVEEITGESPSKEMKELIKLCENYPLLLISISRLISRIPGATIQSFLQDYPSLESALSMKDQQKLVKEVIDSTLSTISEEARSWLFTCSYLGLSRIPRSYLEKWIEIKYPECIEKKPVIRDQIIIEVTESALQKVLDDSFVFPGLFRKALNTLDTGEESEVVKNLLLSLAVWDFEYSKNYQLDLESALNWKLHAEAYLSHSGFHKNSSHDQATLLYQLARVEGEEKRLDKALDYLIQAKQKLDDEGESKLLAKAIQYEAFCLLEKGDTDRAKKCLEQALDIFKKDEKIDQYGVAQCYYELAKCYYLRENYAKSIEYCIKAKEIIKKMDGETCSIDLAKVYRRLGASYFEISDFEKAENSFKQARRIYTLESFDHENPDFIALVNNIAVLKQHTGDLKDAKKEHENLLKILETNHGKQSHPDVALCKFNLGECHLSAKEYEDALYYFNGSALMYTDIFGTSHFLTLDCISRVALCYSKMERFGEAIKYYDQVIDTYPMVRSMKKTQLKERLDQLTRARDQCNDQLNTLTAKT